MAQQRGQAGVFRPPAEVFPTVPAGGIEQDDAPDHRGLIQAPLALLEPQMPGHALREAERAESLRHQRQPAQGGQRVGGRFRIELEREQRRGGVVFSVV